MTGNPVKTIALVTSVLLNIGLAFLVLLQMMDGRAEMSDGRVGILNQDVDVGIFGSGESLFTLPEGLVVREASASGASWFEPYRFRIVITANNERFVNYEPTAEQLAEQEAEFYSAEVSEGNR
jgi:hypothetical protein